MRKLACAFVLVCLALPAEAEMVPLAGATAGDAADSENPCVDGLGDSVLVLLGRTREDAAWGYHGIDRCRAVAAELNYQCFGYDSLAIFSFDWFYDIYDGFFHKNTHALRCYGFDVPEVPDPVPPTEE